MLFNEINIKMSKTGMFEIKKIKAAFTLADFIFNETTIRPQPLTLFLPELPPIYWLLYN